MSSNSTFNCGDLVKLKKDSDYTVIRKGDYGIVWAIYAYQNNEDDTIYEFSYEGTFWDKNGKNDDVMFEEEDAEKVFDLECVIFTEDMKKLWIYLNQKEN